MPNRNGDFLPIEARLTRLAHKASKESATKSGEKSPFLGGVSLLNTGSYFSCGIFYVKVRLVLMHPHRRVGGDTYEIPQR